MKLLFTISVDDAMAGGCCSCTFALLAFLVVAVAANGPALSHWEETLPAVAIPSSLRGSVSPVDGSAVATRFATAVSRGAIFPATTASFCQAAGLMCEEDVDISLYSTEGTGRALGIQTINDFQFDFFLEDDLVKGATMNLAENLHDPIPLRAFLPREVADTLPPLTTSNLPKLTQTFNIDEGTKMATIMATATYLCENPPLPGEERACPTSVEAMAEFVSSQLGQQVRLLGTKGAPEAAPGTQEPVTVLDFTKGSLDEGKKIVICHNLMFPSQLYYCHHVTGTKVVQGSLAAADGSTIHGVGICHLDTTMWSSTHPAFAALNIPRGAEACHWTAQNDMIWVSSHL